MSQKSNKRRNAGPVKKMTTSARAGLTFPVVRVHRILKLGNYAKKVGLKGSVFLTAVLEYLSAEMLELSGNVAVEAKKRRITPRHIMTAIRRDEEFSMMLNEVNVAKGGVIPYLPQAPSGGQGT